MVPTNVTPDVSRHAADGEATTECAACPHPWPSHDRISARFCTATVDGRFSRGCVCTNFPDNAAHHDQNKDTS